VAYPFNTGVHLTSKTVADNAVVQTVAPAHSVKCECGCASKKTAFDPLANDRNIGDGLLPRGFQHSLKSEVDRSTSAGEDKYLSNVDALAFSGLKTPSVVLESYILSSVIAKMEANTEFLPKGTDKALAGNCGKRVMGENLRKKIFGDNVESDSSSKGAVKIIDYRGSVSYQGVMCCHNIWGCPICGRKLSERRKKGLSMLLTAHFDRFFVDSITASLFTIPHSKYDDLADIRKRLVKCYSDMTRSRGYKALMKKLEACGSSRGVEVTWSLVNGFHPHIHVLNFFENSILLHHDYLANTLFDLWTTSVLKNGFEAPSRQAFGCNIIPSNKAGIEAVAEYFSKSESDVNDADIMGYLKKHKEVRSVENSEGREVMGWQTEHEMTKWHLKQARSDGENFRYSPFDFVRGYSIADDNKDEDSKAQFRALWLTYRKAFKGQRQLCTRHKHFKISELELSDEELGSQELEEPVKKVVAEIDFNQWLVLVFMHARGVLLEKARRNGIDGVNAVLNMVNENYFAFFPDNPCGFSHLKTTKSAFYRRVTSKIPHFALMSPRHQSLAIRET
jgi:hypothetical protein